MSMRIVKASCCIFLLSAKLKDKGRCLARRVSLSAITIPTGSFRQKASEITTIRSTAPSCGSMAERSVLSARTGYLLCQSITNTGGSFMQIANILLLGTSGQVVGEMASTSSSQPSVIIEIKYFAELPFVLDDLFSVEHCGSGTIENVDLFLSNTPHCFTTVWNWASGSESLDAFSEVLAGITCPLEDEFVCKSDCSATKYIVASMICYADECYVCFAGDERYWRIYNSETIEICYADERYVLFARDEGHWLVYNSETIEIKSFAELPFVLDDKFFVEHCGSGTIENVDLFLSNTPHCFTTVWNWASGSESLDAFSEVLAGITCPLEDEFFCKSDCSATKYIVASMICYADERYVLFARDEGHWPIYNSETIETVDTWEHLLESFKDCKLQPEVLFFEVIK